MTPPVPLATRRLLLPVFGLSVLAAAGAAYALARPLYMTVLSWVMLLPYRTPFFDLEYVLNTVTCWHQGIDVYATNPCDPLGRPMTYAPLWLRMGFLALDRSWAAPLGLGLAVLFCLSLALLPPTRRWRDLLVIGAAAVSSLAVFAVERGNVDVMIYLAALAAGLAAASGGVVRGVSYALLLAAGLLKFYPLAALLVVLRERLVACLILASVAGAAILGFFLVYHNELARMAPNIPRYPYDTPDVFWPVDLPVVIGMVQLPGGVGQVLRQVLAPSAGAAMVAALANGTALILLALLLACVYFLARRLVVRAENRRVVAGLPPRQGVLLLVGAAMVAGCFFAGQSIGYRGVLLLLVLPGLLLLDQPDVPSPLRLVSRCTILAILIVMFRLVAVSALQWLGLQATPVGLAAWAGFELLWWWIVAVLLGLLGCLAAGSPAAHDAWALIARLRRG